MSGRVKRILYDCYDGVLTVAAIAAMILMVLYRLDVQSRSEKFAIFTIVFLIAFLFLRPTILHEVGHLLFGLCAGLRFVSVQIGFLHITRRGVSFAFNNGFAGQTQMVPKSQKNVKKRLAFFAVGGTIFNLVYGITFLILFYVLPVAPVISGLALLAPFHILWGLSELFPIELPAGRTDGMILLDMIKNTPYAQVFASVLTAQGILFRNSFSEISEDLLFKTPVIREDNPAFISLSLLRWQYYYSKNDEEGVKKVGERLVNLMEYLSNPELYLTAAFSLWTAGEKTRTLEVLKRGTTLATQKDILNSLKSSKGNPLPLIAYYTFTGKDKEKAEATAKKEPFLGVRELYFKMLENAEKRSSSAEAEEH